MLGPSGTMLGSASAGALRLPSRSLSCNGTNQYLLRGNDSTIQTAIGSNYSIGAWCYLNNLTNIQGVINYRRLTGANNSPFLCQLIVLTDGTVQGAVRNSDFTASIAATGPSALTVSAWHHLVFVRSGNSGTVYLDGAAGATASVSGSGSLATAVSDTLTVGCQPDGAGSYYRFVDGLIDGAFVAQSALTSIDVSALYNGGSIVRWPDLSFTTRAKMLCWFGLDVYSDGSRAINREDSTGNGYWLTDVGNCPSSDLVP